MVRRNPKHLVRFYLHQTGPVARQHTDLRCDVWSGLDIDRIAQIDASAPGQPQLVQAEVGGDAVDLRRPFQVVAPPEHQTMRRRCPVVDCKHLVSAFIQDMSNRTCKCRIRREGFSQESKKYD